MSLSPATLFARRRAQGIAPSAPIDQFVQTDQTPAALNNVLQRLIKVTLTIQTIQGAVAEKMPPAAALSLIQDVSAPRQKPASHDAAPCPCCAPLAVLLTPYK